MLEGETVTGGVPVLMGLSGHDLETRTRVPGGLGMRIYDPNSEARAESKLLERRHRGINIEVLRWRAGVPGARNPAGWRWQEPDAPPPRYTPSQYGVPAVHRRMITFGQMVRDYVDSDARRAVDYEYQLRMDARRAAHRARMTEFAGAPRPYNPEELNAD